MIRQNFYSSFLVLLVLAIFASACMPTAQAVGGTGNTQSAGVAAPQPTATQETAPALHKGYVLFDQEKGEFKGYAFDGSLLFTSPAPGIQYPSPWATEVVRDAVYLMTDKGHEVYRSTPEGVTKVNIPDSSATAFAVSPDEKYYVWSILDPKTGTTTLSVGNLVFEGETIQVTDAKQIASFPASGMEAFFFLPFEWLPDGKLLFDRQMTGIGGYILFGGHNGLYSYDPASGQIETIVPAEEKHGLCLDNYRPDLNIVTFDCDQESRQIVIRNLNDQSEQILPALPDQGAAGSTRFSPSGQWLAYAVARNNYEDESGQVVVVPADLSAEPKPIAKVDGNTYANVHGWLDEDTILFSRIEMPFGTLWSIKRDGSDLKQLNEGSWIGWIP